MKKTKFRVNACRHDVELKAIWTKPAQDEWKITFEAYGKMLSANLLKHQHFFLSACMVFFKLLIALCLRLLSGKKYDSLTSPAKEEFSTKLLNVLSILLEIELV